MTPSQRRHARRSRIRAERRRKEVLYSALCSALDDDDVPMALGIIRCYPEFKTQLLLCDIQSIRMGIALIEAGTPCNYWTLEGANTPVCVEFIREYTKIRG